MLYNSLINRPYFYKTAKFINNVLLIAIHYCNHEEKRKINRAIESSDA